MNPVTLPSRIAANITVDANGCWIWTGLRDPGGYGVISIHDRNRRTHRVSYELFVGPIPEGLHIDHLCRVRRCCNPSHLEPVTNRENTLRGAGPAAVNHRKTHCYAGHPFDAMNTRFRMDRHGIKRICRECDRIRNVANYRNKVGLQVSG